MTNKIGVQWKNKPDPTFQEISLMFDKVTSTGVENSGKIKRSRGSNLWWRKCTSRPPAPQTTAWLSEREWHRGGFTCPVELGCKLVWRLRTRMEACHSSWYGCDVSYGYKIKSIMEYGNGLCCQSSDWHKKLWQQHKKGKRGREICWKLQINSYT